MRRIFCKAILTLLVLVGAKLPTFGALPKTCVNSGEKLLPEQTKSSKKQGLSVQQSSKAAQWSEFNKKNGGWNILLDELTQTPIAAFGEYIQINGYSSINDSNIAEASFKFINDNSKLFNVNPDNLKILRKEYANNKWFISYKQYYQGLEVLLSDIQLVITKNGKVMNFKMKYYNDINISTSPLMSSSELLNSSKSNIDSKKKTSSILSAEQPKILPYKKNSKLEYKLVYQFKVNSGADRYISYVNANNGELEWRYNTINKSDLNISAQGDVKTRGSNIAPITVQMPNMFVNSGGNVVTLDTNGRYLQKYTAPIALSANFEGKYVNVGVLGASPSKYSGTASKAGDYPIVFDDNNSRRYERNMYYYCNNVIDYFHKLDPTLDILEHQFYVELQYGEFDYGSNINAFSAGDTIVFINVDNTAYRMADCPEIFYHEFGHSVNKLFYIEKNGGTGMLNDGCNEGTADVNAAMMLDESLNGKGYDLSDTAAFIRNCDNTNYYPNDATGESHEDGKIISGAFWDLRKLTDLATTRKLAHYARYSLPDDEDFGNAAFNWFIAVLTADENDNDFSNGTPHYKEIVEAFNKHGIGMNYLISPNIVHTPLGDAKPDGKDYVVNFKVNTDVSTYQFSLDSAFVVYKTKSLSGAVEEHILLAKYSNGAYSAIIPAQSQGTIVSYWFEFIVNPMEIRMKIYSPNLASPNTFLVGYNSAYIDNCESYLWTVGGYNDDAKNGLWDLGIPDLINSNYYGYLKPGADHSQNGYNCYVTGLSSPDSASFEEEFYTYWLSEAPNGKTSITSQMIDLTALSNPVIKCYDFFGYYSIYGSPSYKFYASSDGGASWIEVNKFNKTKDWEVNYFILSDYLEITNHMKFKFVYDVDSYSSIYGVYDTVYYPYAAGSACFDDFQIFSINNGLANGVKENDEYIENSIAQPNPFIESITLSNLFGESKVYIYNQLGSLIFQSNISDTKFIWNGLDNYGNQAPNGIYYYIIQAGEKRRNGSFVRIK